MLGWLGDDERLVVGGMCSMLPYDIYCCVSLFVVLISWWDLCGNNCGFFLTWYEKVRPKDYPYPPLALSVRYPQINGLRMRVFVCFCVALASYVMNWYVDMPTWCILQVHSVLAHTHARTHTHTHTHTRIHARTHTRTHAHTHTHARTHSHTHTHTHTHTHSLSLSYYLRTVNQWG